MSTRKVFLAQLAGGGWALLTSGCGGGGDGYNAPAPPPPPAGSCSATLIVGNHGHTLAFATADLASTVAMSYGIQGSADHSHQVTLSATQLAQLKAGQAVTVVSSSGSSAGIAAHTHDVTVGCG